MWPSDDYDVIGASQWKGQFSKTVCSLLKFKFDMAHEHNFRGGRPVAFQELLNCNISPLTQLIPMEFCRMMQNATLNL